MVKTEDALTLLERDSEKVKRRKDWKWNLEQNIENYFTNIGKANY